MNDDRMKSDNYPGAVLYQRDGDAILRRNACVFGPGDLFCAMWPLLGLAGLDASDWTPPVRLLATPRTTRRRRQERARLRAPPRGSACITHDASASLPADSAIGAAPSHPGSSKVGTGGELRAGSAGIEGILPSLEGGTPSIPGYSRRARDQYGETQTPDGDF